MDNKNSNLEEKIKDKASLGDRVGLGASCLVIGLIGGAIAHFTDQLAESHKYIISFLSITTLGYLGILTSIPFIDGIEHKKEAIINNSIGYVPLMAGLVGPYLI